MRSLGGELLVDALVGVVVPRRRDVVLVAEVQVLVAQQLEADVVRHLVARRPRLARGNERLDDDVLVVHVVQNVRVQTRADPIAHGIAGC